MDKDLSSIQEARDLARAAKDAQHTFKHFEQDQVDKIVKAMADAGYAAGRGRCGPGSGRGNLASPRPPGGGGGREEVMGGVVWRDTGDGHGPASMDARDGTHWARGRGR